jgi:hypothetical protein
VKRSLAVFALLSLLFPVTFAHAAKLKITVTEFKVTGSPSRDDLKTTLQSLLASRLESDSVQIVEAGEASDLTVTGTYITLGKVFSLDARITDRSGKVLGRAFEQGESNDEIIPALTKLSQKIGTVIAKSGNSLATAPVVQPSPAAPVPLLPPEIVNTKPMVSTQKGETDIIKPEAATTKVIDSGMIGQRLEGVIVGVAEATSGNSGERQLVAALSHEIRLYSQGKELKLLNALKDFGQNERIVAIDTADLDADGVSELYVTIFHGEELSSRVYVMENGGFRRIAASLPYFFRAMSLKGGSKKVYAQEMGRDDDYYGGLYEVVKNGDAIKYANQLRLPRFANIFNCNQISDQKGEPLFIVIHPDNYLIVYDGKGEVLWKGSDKYGGSENFFLRDNSQNERVTGSKFRKSFLEQRITVTTSGDIIIPKNEGFFVLGDSRSFTKNSIYAFRWNGASLDELWHTKLSQNYLSDYLYDESRKELLLAEVVKKEGVIDKGASAISIKRVE